MSNTSVSPRRLSKLALWAAQRLPLSASRASDAALAARIENLTKKDHRPHLRTLRRILQARQTDWLGAVVRDFLRLRRGDPFLGL